MWRRRKPPERTQARLAMARAIRMARRATGLTQAALGKRLGLKDRAVYRWECADAVPSRRRLGELVTAIQAIDPSAAARLATELASAAASEGKKVAPALIVPSPIPAPISLELAMFSLAEDLELAPRRVRSALVPFLKRLRAANVSVEVAEQVLEALTLPSRAEAPAPLG